MQLLTPALGLIIWTLLAFLVVFFILKKFAWPSILNGLRNREETIAASLATAERIKEWSDGRGWKNLRMLSSNKNTYNTDYFAEDEKQSQLPALNVFRKTPEGIFHFYNTNYKRCHIDLSTNLASHC